MKPEISVSQRRLSSEFGIEIGYKKHLLLINFFENGVTILANSYSLLQFFSHSNLHAFIVMQQVVLTLTEPLNIFVAFPSHLPTLAIKEASYKSAGSIH